MRLIADFNWKRSPSITAAQELLEGFLLSSEFNPGYMIFALAWVCLEIKSYIIHLILNGSICF